MRTLVFGFAGTNTEKIAQKFSDIADVKIIQSKVDFIEGFIANTDFSPYDYILGMGMYSGRDKYKVRIETLCTSQFRDNKNNFKQLQIPYFIDAGGIFTLAKGMGNSWCNLVSYKILSKNPGVRYTFLHVPKFFDTSIMIKSARDALISL